MKVLLVSSSSGSRGGGELYLLYLGRALAKRAHEVTLWASSHSRMDELANSFSGIGGVIRADYRNTYDRPGRSIASYFDQQLPRRLAREWQNAGTSLIHLNKQNLEDGLDLLAAVSRSRIPSICTIHITQTAKYLKAVLASARDFVSRRALQRYRGKIVTVLENRRRDLLDLIGPSPRVRTVPNGVPLYDLTRREKVRALVRPELGIADDAKLFIGVGRMVAQKRPLLFLDQAERALRAVPEAQFLWVGDGPLSASWDDQVRRRGLTRMVHRLPWQSDVQRLLLAADAFLHVAEFEGLPLAILEAMSAGLPCAITRNLLEEMPFLDETNSLSIEPNDAWLSALSNQSRLANLGLAARDLIETEFSFGTMAERYEALYDDALKACA